jgi:hypothetical protein
VILGVIGSRTFFDYALLKSVLDKLIITEIVSGGAIGADSLAARYAHENDITLVEYLPDRAKYGRKAPFVRNKLIVNDSQVIIAFWDGKSKGTKHSLDYAHSKGIKCVIVPFT